MTDSALLYELDRVAFRAGGKAILSGLSLGIARAGVTALVGPNGSGKSTLLRLLARQSVPTGGRVLFEGRPVVALGRREFARAVAYMPQFTPPAEGMTVAELVALGRFPWHGALGRFGEEDRGKVEAAIDACGLRPFADRLVDSLSGGERQRAWLAMMLAQDPRCLLLDEPTSALDVAQQAAMLRLLRDLARERGVAVVVVLHDINMAARIADGIVALRDGSVVASGPGEAIMDAEVLERVFGLPLGVMPHPAGGLLSFVP